MKEFTRRDFMKGGAAITATAMLSYIGISLRAMAAGDESSGGPSEMVLVNPEDQKPTGPEPRLSTESFNVSLTGNQSLQKQMVLSGSYLYWIMTVSNTGSTDIQVDVNGTVYTVSAKTTGNIYSTSWWFPRTYTIGFTSVGAGTKMSGTAVCKICTTLAEATP